MDRWTNGTCEVNGIEVHYLRTGGGKPSIVLLHGLMGNGACWTPLARALEADYDVVMPDARGHGNSSKPEQGYSYDSLATDVVGLIEVLGLDTPVILGHSMGGLTATVVASQNSDRLRGVVFVDPTFLIPQRQREVYESDVATRHLQILNQPKEDYLAEIQIRKSRRSKELIELIAKARYQTSIYALKVLRPPNPDFVQLINTINIPGLLVIGDVGGIVSLELAKELVDLNQNLEYLQIAEAGHGIPYDQPEALATIVKSFLRARSI